jgi:hypothetical protein
MHEREGQKAISCALRSEPITFCPDLSQKRKECTYAKIMIYGNSVPACEMIYQGKIRNVFKKSITKNFIL